MVKQQQQRLYQVRYRIPHFGQQCSQVLAVSATAARQHVLARVHRDCAVQATILQVHYMRKATLAARAWLAYSSTLHKVRNA